MNYGEVLTRAWKIVWKFKVLWIFGILASCGTGSNGRSGGGGNNVSYQFSNGELPPQFEQFFAKQRAVLPTTCGGSSGCSSA